MPSPEWCLRMSSSVELQPVSEWIDRLSCETLSREQCIPEMYARREQLTDRNCGTSRTFWCSAHKASVIFRTCELISLR